MQFFSSAEKYDVKGLNATPFGNGQLRLGIQLYTLVASESLHIVLHSNWWGFFWPEEDFRLWSSRTRFIITNHACKPEEPGMRQQGVTAYGGRGVSLTWKRRGLKIICFPIFKTKRDTVRRILIRHCRKSSECYEGSIWRQNHHCDWCSNEEDTWTMTIL